MSALLAIPGAAPTLDALATTATAEHEASLRTGEASVRHAVACGQALLAAQQQVTVGEWDDWLLTNTEIERTRAYIYMRLARYTDTVLPARCTTIKDALDLVAHEADARTRRSLSAEQVVQLRALHADGGWSMRRIAAELGIGVSTVWWHTSSKAARQRALQRQRQRSRAAKKALQCQEREQAIARAGGAVADGYLLMRRAAQTLDRALSQARDPQMRGALSRALTRLHSAEDAMLEAIGSEYGGAK